MNLICSTGKQCFGNKHAAEQMITTQKQRLRRVRNHVPRLRPYECPLCGNFHITSETSKDSR